MDKERKERFLLTLDMALREAMRTDSPLNHYLNDNVLEEYSVFDYESYSVEAAYLIESAVTDYRDLLASSKAASPMGLNLVLVRMAVKDRLRQLQTVITLHDPQRPRSLNRSGDAGMMDLSAF